MVKFTIVETKEKGEISMKENNNITRVCSFYVNDWHLTTMLLPYINKTIDKQGKVITILENSLKSKIEELFSKMNLKIETQNKILEIDWNSNSNCKYEQIINQVKTIEKDIQEINIIVKGTNKYKIMANKNIQQILKEITGKKVNIIDCYDITKYKDINNILDKNDLTLNTSGIRKIIDVFPNYKKENKIG